MSYRDILVQVDETPAGADRALAAASLARRCGAHLTGLFLTSDPVNTRALVDGFGLMAVAPDRFIEDGRKAVLEASELARIAFEASAGDDRIASDWLTTNADFNGDVYAASRRFDLTLFPTSAFACRGLNKISAAEVALASGGPVLMMPDQSFQVRLARRVLIAWKGSRESARALHDAWPLLEQAEEIHAVVVSPDLDRGPDGGLQRHLERHGVEANVIVDPSRDVNPAAVLRRHAFELGADLIVMGLYGHSRFGETVWGGMTDAMLRDPPCPLLLSH